MRLPLYQPRYYERAAARHLAALGLGPVFANVAWGLAGNLACRPELDAVVMRDRQVVPVEVKSFRLDEACVEEVLAKYRGLGLAHLMLVAPAANPAAAAVLAVCRNPAVEFLAFRPPQEGVRDWYQAHWPALVPEWVQAALRTGQHHIRFILTMPTNNGRFAIGQQRSRMYDVAALKRALGNLPHAPARVLWTPQRFSIPRDLIARKARVTPLGGFVGVDFDGDRLHRARHACQLDRAGECRFCLLYARQELQRLDDLLDGFPRIDVVASGGRGLHVYYRDDGSVRQRLLALARSRQVRLDESVTASLKHLLALPGSLNAATVRPVASLSQPTASDLRPEAARC